MEIFGEDALLDGLRRINTDGIKRVREKLVEVMGAIAFEAAALAPKDPETVGQLADSVRVITPLFRNGKLTTGVQAGGVPLQRRLEEGRHTQQAWAIVQHEDLTLRHPHGGQAKFVEKPFMQHIDKVPDAILEALDEVTK